MRYPFLCVLAGPTVLSENGGPLHRPVELTYTSHITCYIFKSLQKSYTFYGHLACYM
jgi:hypothetical protein